MSADLPDLPEDVVAALAEPVAAGAGATITPYRDGPLIVRGDFRLVDTEGGEIDPGRATVALCRCGRSAIKPFCDGSHKRGRLTVARESRSEVDGADATAPGEDEPAP